MALQSLLIDTAAIYWLTRKLKKYGAPFVKALSHTFVDISLDDQTQVDSKPAGQPEHASLNQCQLTAASRQELVLWAPPAGGGDKVSL